MRVFMAHISKKNYLMINKKSLIGKKAYEHNRPDRVGILKKIQFHNSDFSECWYLFEWQNGAYLIPFEDVRIISSQLKFDL